MLMTLAIVAILVSLAVPRYEQFMAQQDVNRVTQQMRDHLSLARTYAQTHQTLVQLCPVQGGRVNDEIPSCSAVNIWNAWMVAEVDDRGAIRQVIARSPPTLGAVQIASGSRSYIELNRQGGADGVQGTFTITSTQLNKIDKYLTLASNGRIKECNTRAACQ
jgi:Tfp pilus assembly protein FimT